MRYGLGVGVKKSGLYTCIIRRRSELSWCAGGWQYLDASFIFVTILTFSLVAWVSHKRNPLFGRRMYAYLSIVGKLTFAGMNCRRGIGPVTATNLFVLIRRPYTHFVPYEFPMRGIPHCGDGYAC